MKNFFILTACFVLFLVLYGVASAETWRFGVIPDTQWQPLDVHYGVSVHILDAVVAEMIDRKVDLVVHVGDVVQENSPEAYKTVVACLKPLKDAGIKFYPVRGNHDARTLDGAAQFAAAFPGQPGTPGAEGNSPNLPGMAGLTYAFVHKDTKFVMLDFFRVPEKISSSRNYYKPNDFQPWIDEQLKAKDHKNVFVVSHRNLIGQNHKDTIFTSDTSDQDRYPEMQNAFFKSLHENGVKYYLSGHDHMYYRGLIKSPDRNYEVTQLICGSCSNNLYTPKKPFSPRDFPLAQELGRNGCMIFTIDDDRVTGEYYSTKAFGTEPLRPQWQLRERFGYTSDGKTFEEQFTNLKKFDPSKAAP